MKDKNETTRKVKIEDLDFIDKFISDRHSLSIDKKRISQARGWNLITKYLKLDKETYNKLVRVPIKEEKE